MRDMRYLICVKQDSQQGGELGLFLESREDLICNSNWIHRLFDSLLLLIRNVVTVYMIYPISVRIYWLTALDSILDYQCLRTFFLIYTFNHEYACFSYYTYLICALWIHLLASLIYVMQWYLFAFLIHVIICHIIYILNSIYTKSSHFLTVGWWGICCRELLWIWRNPY